MATSHFSPCTTEREATIPRGKRVQSDVHVLQPRQTPQRKRHDRRAGKPPDLNSLQSRHIYRSIPAIRPLHSIRSQATCFSAFSPITSASNSSSVHYSNEKQSKLWSVTLRSEGMKLRTSRSCVVALAESELSQTRVCNWQAEEKSVGRKRTF